MEKTPISAKIISGIFKAGLRGIYEEREILRFTYILFEEFLGWSRTDFHLRYEEPLRDDVVGRFTMALAELRQNRPIQYITGIAHFCGLGFRVTPAVLIPRQETEELVGIVVRDNERRKSEPLVMLDIGTGTGCIAISLAKEFRNSRVDAIENSLPAIEVAGENASGLGYPIGIFSCDILDRGGWKAFPEYDVIVSNPPYVLESEKPFLHKNVLDYEPATALFVPDSDPLLFYKVVGEFSKLHLKRGGALYLEINERFGPEIREMLISKGFGIVEIIRDLNGKDRFARADQ
jgi:release factor glutamine methyltransferase